MLCNEFAGDFPLVLREQNQQFVDFSGHPVEVVPHIFCQHAFRLRFDFRFVPFHVIPYPLWHLVISQFDAFVDYSGAFEEFHHPRLSSVDGTVLVAEYQHCERLWVFEVFGEGLEVGEFLCVLYHHHLFSFAHGERQCSLYDVCHADVCAVDRCKVEVPFLGFDDAFADECCQPFDVVWLLAHKVVYGGDVPGLYVSYDGFVCDAVCCLLCHGVVAELGCG